MEYICLCWLILITLILTPGIQSQSLVGPDPDVSVEMGTTHTLTCRRGPDWTSGSIAWDEALDGGGRNTLFINEGKETADAKYANFNLDPDNLYDLVITNIAIEDEGTYVCRHPLSATEISAKRKVEVEPTMAMTQGGTGVSAITATVGEVTEVVCKAEGARPLVDILWSVNEIPITSDIISTNISTDGGNTFDTTSTLSYSPVSTHNGGTLKCATSGQQEILPVKAEATLEVRYAPVVAVTYGDNKIICTADAHPDVTSYAITIIGTGEVYDPVPGCSGSECRFDYTVEEETSVECNATNDVGVGTAETTAVPGAEIRTTPILTTPNTESTTDQTVDGSGLDPGIIIAIVVVLLVLIALAVGGYFGHRWYKGRNKPKNGQSTQMTTNSSAGNKLVDKKTPTPAPRNGKSGAQDNEEGKKVTPNDNAENLVYAQLDHGGAQGRPKSSNNIIRTDEVTEYADVKTFIPRPSSS